MNEPCDLEPKYWHFAFIYIVMMLKCQFCQAHDNGVERRKCVREQNEDIGCAAGMVQREVESEGDEKSDFAVG